MINEDTNELFEDIDFMEQPGGAPRSTPWAWALAGAALGLGALYLSHPKHGERRRGEMRDGCRKWGKACGDGMVAQLKCLRERWWGTDFQAEIRSHAPQYLQ